MLQFGLVLFALFSVGAALASNTGELITARAAMGAAAALVYPATLAIVAFIVSGIFLLTLVPDRTRPGTDVAAEDLALSDEGASAEKPASTTVVDLGQGTFGPLGGAGGPPRRIAQQLPVERDGGTHFVPIDEVVAVHANAHYTYIFDGKTNNVPVAEGERLVRITSGEEAKRTGGSPSNTRSWGR